MVFNNRCVQSEVSNPGGVVADQPSKGYGQFDPSDGASDYSKYAFVMAQILGRISTIRVVKVIAVSNDGEVSPVGTVDVQPLVNQLDGVGNATPHGVVFGVPYFRLQGGANAIIIDPIVGDLGFMVVSDRDISAVKAAKAQANPGSRRRFDLADGIYVGGILNGTPERYIRFNENSISAKVGNCEVSLTETNAKLVFGAFNITIDADAIHFNGPVLFDGVASGVGNIVDFGASELKTTGPATVGSVNSTGTVVAAGKSLTTHTHHVATAPGDTGPPL